MPAFLALVALATAAAALPVQESALVALATRDCGSIPPPQQSLMDQVLEICNDEGVGYKLTLATFETAFVESNFNVLDCGDQDSVGLYQQRPSKGWCPDGRRQCMDVKHSTQMFLDGAKACAQEHPSWPAGSIAQCVQGSQFPKRYNEAEGRASQALAAAMARASNGSANVESAPKASTKKPAKKPAAKPAPKPAPKPAKGVKPPKNVAPGTIKSGCKKYVPAKHGNTCSFFHSKYGIPLKTFFKVNPHVHSSCNNLQVGEAYCVQV